MNSHQAYKQVNVIIVGGGFAGVKLAQQLLKNKKFSVTMIDRNNYNYFPPLLYQVATGFLDASGISYPFRKLFRNARLSFRMGEVVDVSTTEKVIYLNNGRMDYDYLVLASGVKSNFFGIKSIQENAIPMKTLDDALRMRNTLYKTMEAASISTSRKEQQMLLTIVVAGGGPTGVEVTGMLAEIKKNIFLKEYPELKDVPSKIYIVDGGQHLLSPMSSKSQKEAYRVLSDLGVDIILNTHVSDFSNDEVKLSNGLSIRARILIWATGVTAATFKGLPESSIGIGKRIITDRFNKVKGSDFVYAIGDCSIQMEDARYPRGHPQLAQVAIQQGKTLAVNLGRMIINRPLKPFNYYNKGEMAIIGREHAVIDLFRHRLHLKGLIALSAWLLVHLLSLVNTANKGRTLISWIVAYLSKDQSLRLVLRPETDRKTTEKLEQ